MRNGSNGFFIFQKHCGRWVATTCLAPKYAQSSTMWFPRLNSPPCRPLYRCCYVLSNGDLPSSGPRCVLYFPFINPCRELTARLVACHVPLLSPRSVFHCFTPYTWRHPRAIYQNSRVCTAYSASCARPLRNTSGRSD